MGTARAYGGTAGWKPVVDHTQEWIESRPQSGSRGGGSSGGPAETAVPSDAGPTAESSSPDSMPGPTISAQLARVLRDLGRRLTSDGPAGRGSRSAPGGAGATGGGGRSISHASRVGGRVSAGAYGVRSGTAEALADLGLTLADLTGLSKTEQAQRVVDAALGPSGAVDRSELRQVNFEVVLWALNQEVEPTPLELTNRWVVEYVWEAWITESGPRIRDLAATGRDRVLIEQEMRAALEVLVSAGGLPEGRVLTSADFESAIQSALGSLRRIGGAAA